jgi:hypothetical protein
MIEILLFLLPSCISILLYLGLGKIDSAKLKLLIPLVLFFLSLILFEIIISGPGNSGIVSVSAWFITIAFATSCAVAIAMNVFPLDIKEKWRQFAAFLAPFISIPFIFVMIITPEMVLGQAFPDYYFTKRLPLSGWLIDGLTFGFEFTAGDGSVLPGILLNIGFFIEMVIVMLLLFWYLKTVSGSPVNNNFSGDE